jgi:hypothetical protein
MDQLDSLFGLVPPGWRLLDPARVRAIRTGDAAYEVHAVPMVASPSMLAALRVAGRGFVCEGPATTTRLAPREAMPVRIYAVRDGYALHVPCGQFDRRTPTQYTFLAPSMRYAASSSFESAPLWPAGSLSLSPG